MQATRYSPECTNTSNLLPDETTASADARTRLLRWKKKSWAVCRPFPFCGNN